MRVYSAVKRVTVAKSSAQPQAGDAHKHQANEYALQHRFEILF